MHDTGDMELLRDYDRQGSEVAFAALVQRHVSLVYSAALRHVGIAAHAEEITQAVFVILARKAAGLRPDTILESWLYETTRLTALSFRRGERRRQFREQEAYMQSTLQESADASTWNQLAPLLDEAMARLGKKDRDAVLLRFFKNKNLREIAAALKVNETAAQKRVHRAVEKLRAFFTKRGIIFPAAVLTAAISANSVQAAPVALAKAVTAIAVAKGAAAGGSILILVKGALKLMAWAKVKMAVVTTAVVILAAGTATVAIKDFSPKKEKPQNEKPRRETSWVTDSVMDTYLAKENLNSSLTLTKAPAVLSVQATHFPYQTGGSTWLNWPNTNHVEGIGRDTTLVSILQMAYGFEPTRMVLPNNLPDTNFDFMATLPNCSRIAFQDEIEQTLGLRGHPEMVRTNVLLLQVKNADAPDLKISTTTTPGWRQQWGDTVYCATNLSISDLGSFLEQTPFKRPVIDLTGLTDKYDIDIKWEAHDEDSLKKVLLDQLGLELVPTNMPIEMLIVVESKTPSSISFISALPANALEAKPQPVLPGQVDFPKETWAFAGYASPKAALETFFWALNKEDTTNLEASMTPGSQEDFRKTLQEASETENEVFTKLAPMLKNIAGYRILGTNAFDFDFQIAMDGGVNQSDIVTTRAVGTGWKVDEIPLHFFETNPPPVMPRQVDYPKTSWAFAGYASPEAALQTYFWAINKQDAKNFEASMTTSALQDAGEPIEQAIKEAAPALKKISGYRILGINAIAADEIVFKIATEGGAVQGDDSDEMTIKKIGTEWKVDETP